MIVSRGGREEGAGGVNDSDVMIKKILKKVSGGI